MTRINYGIPVENLTDQHLLAEIRELPRIPRKVKTDIINGKRVNLLPKKDNGFRLGSGHVRFFYDKQHYLHVRYNKLLSEINNRGFNCEEDVNLFYISNSPKVDYMFVDLFYGLSIPTQEDINLVKERIATRIRDSKQTPRYRRENIDKETYIKQILQYEDNN